MKDINEEHLKHYSAQHKAQQEQAWSGISDTLDKLIDAMAKKHNIELVEEGTKEELTMEQAIERAIDPLVVERELKLKEAKKQEEEVELVEEGFEEASKALRDAITTLDNSTLEFREFKGYTPYKKDSPFLKLMKESIKKSLKEVEEKTSTKHYLD